MGGRCLDCLRWPWNLTQPVLESTILWISVVMVVDFQELEPHNLGLL
jgi:hypothetical protein